ncbi:extracellular solute-binding protein [soil metagenome]
MKARDRYRLPKLSVSRRTVLKGGVGAVAASTLPFMSHRNSSLAQYDDLAPLPDLSGETIRIFTFAGNPFIEGPVRLHAPMFEELTGATVEIITAPFADLYTKAQQVAQTGSGEFDVLLLSNTWVADFVDLDYIIPFDDYIARDAAEPNLQWDDVPDGLKFKNSWGGQTYAFIVDNDNHSMFYRKDILESEEWQEAYMAETGAELSSPPQTLPEFTQVAKFFTGKDWDPSVGGDKYGFITSVTRGAQSFWYAYPWTAAYTVVPTDAAPAQGIYLLDPDMTPLVNTEGFVRGLTEYVDTINGAMKPGGDAVRGTVITDITNGSTLMSFDWGDTGPASVAPDSLVKDKLGFSMVPGVTEYYDWQNDSWVTVEGEPHRVPTHAFNGWSYFITSQASNPDAAWEWIKFASSPGVSAVDVAAPDSGYQPWRNSHSENLEPWVGTGWTESEAATYVQTILDVTDHPNAVFDPRIPQASAYQEALELHVLRAVSGEADPQSAMDDCASDFESLTDDAGRDEQIAAYRAHLGLS